MTRGSTVSALDALPLTARELMRVLREEVRGWHEPDPFQDVSECRHRLLRIAGLLVTEERSRERLVDGARGVERCIWILMD
jgi:hypothetical protein